MIQHWYCFTDFLDDIDRIASACFCTSNSRFNSCVLVMVDFKFCIALVKGVF